MTFSEAQAPWTISVFGCIHVPLTMPMSSSQPGYFDGIGLGNSQLYDYVAYFKTLHVFSIFLKKLKKNSSNIV
jgi:hypothetical protein